MVGNLKVLARNDSNFSESRRKKEENDIPPPDPLHHCPCQARELKQGRREGNSTCSVLVDVSVAVASLTKGQCCHAVDFLVQCVCSIYA